MAVLGYLPKLKRGLRLPFGVDFLHDFPIKCYLFNTLYMDKVSMPYLFYLHKINNFYRQKLEYYLQSSSKVMADREKKKGNENTKIWISQERKELFR